MVNWLIWTGSIIVIYILYKIIDFILEDKKRKYIPQDIKLKLAARDGAKCRYCHATDNLHIDHINPVSKYQNRGFNDVNEIDNLQLLCQSCNLKKSNKIGGLP